MTAKGDFFPRRINDHVPNMQYAADVRFGGVGTITIPAPIASVAVAGAHTGAEGKEEVLVDVGAKFGRNITITPAVAAGSALTVTVRGNDYLGQPMSENFAVTSAGVTAVAGKKAFRYVTEVEVAGGDAAGALNVGFGNVLGLPYRLIDNYSEVVDKNDVASGGTIVAGVSNATAQTATTGDPRGTYAPHSSNAPDGEHVYELTALFDTSNLHGNPHFFA